VVGDEAITLLSAPEKVGKTTLLSLLLDRRRAGGQLLGRSVYPGRTILCSEEHERLWALRQPPLDFGPELIFHRPTRDCPTRGRWKRFIEDLCTYSMRDYPFDLLVIDTAATFLPLADRNARNLRWSISQLRFLAKLPTAVLVLNQSRYMHRPLAAIADIVIDMAIPRGLGPTRRRTFTGVGRYPGTLRSVTAELNAEGTDYVLVGGDAPPRAPMLPTLKTLLAQSSTPLTHRELLARWPGPAPREDTLWRTLARGCDTGVFQRSGGGTKIEAFRFGLANETKAPVEEATAAPELVLPPVNEQEPAAPAPTLPAPAPTPAREPTTPASQEPPVRLPWPWNRANPADVPEEVWQKARAASGR
jgi:hypothetical protein